MKKPVSELKEGDIVKGCGTVEYIKLIPNGRYQLKFKETVKIYNLEFSTAFYCENPTKLELTFEDDTYIEFKDGQLSSVDRNGNSSEIPLDNYPNYKLRQLVNFLREVATAIENDLT